MTVLVFAYEFGDGKYVLRKCADHDESAVLVEPYEDLIQVCCAVPLRIQFHSCHSMLVMMDDIQAA